MYYLFTVEIEIIGEETSPALRPRCLVWPAVYVHQEDPFILDGSTPRSISSQRGAAFARIHIEKWHIEAICRAC